MAKKKAKPALSIDQARLQRLPQKADAWQLDARPMEVTVRAGKQRIQPWMIVVASDTNDQILAFELMQTVPELADIWRNVVQAITKPAHGKPHRPTEVQVRPEDPMVSLKPPLADLGIRLATTEELDLLDQVFEELAEEMAGDQQPGMLDMPSVTPRMVQGLFAAAAEFYKHAPWKKVGERPIQVTCPQFDSGPWYAILMGQGGMTAGLVLYDSLETLNRIKTGDLSDEENARLTSALALVFGEKDDLPEADLEAVEQYGWKTAGPKAVPSAYRKEPGLSMRPPLVWELELLEGCLRAIPSFVKGRKSRDVTPLEMKVPVATRELPLTLSWLKEER